jgi:hypothetical protein
MEKRDDAVPFNLEEELKKLGSKCSNPSPIQEGCSTWNLRRLITELSNTTAGDT